MIVCIEGADGCGKSEVAAAVGLALGGCDVISFPNDAAFTGPAIRAYLRKEWEVWDVDPSDGDMGHSPEGGALAFQALQVANRMELMPRLIEAREDGDDIVLCRYWQSAWVYGQLDGLPADFLERVHAAMIQPDLSILLDAKPETCMARRERRDGARKAERYEGRLERTRKIVESYRLLWHYEAPYTRRGRWVVVDAEPSLEDVVAQTLMAIGPRPGTPLGEVFNG